MGWGCTEYEALFCGCPPLVHVQVGAAYRCLEAYQQVSSPGNLIMRGTAFTGSSHFDDSIVRMLNLWERYLLHADLKGALVVDGFHGGRD